ncbi:B12-binding domain-containing radical SAM protein [Streptomyces sp. NPDC003480]
MSPRTILVFPPAADPSLPYGALPLLGAVLRRAGHEDVRVRDLNLEAFEYFLSPEVLQQCADRMARAPAWAPDVVSQITEARRILRDPDDFYRPERLLFAKYHVQLAATLVTSHTPHLHFGKYSYSTAPYDSYEQVRHAVEADGGPLDEYFRDVAVPSLLAARPDVIGVCVPYFSQLIPSFLLAAAVREADPRVHVSFGGPVVTWGKEVLAADPRFGRWVDSVVLGEGDETFPQLVDAIAGNRDPGGIAQVLWYANGRVEANPAPGAPPDLDRLPTPDYTLMPMDRYFAPEQVICVTPTRGCYYNKCAFCNYAFIKLTPYRMRSPKLLADDMATISAATGQHVFSLESDVILPRDLGLISQAVLARGLNVKWHAVARFEKGLTADLLALMRQAGCVRLYMGLESANDRVLEAMKKGTTSARMAEILRLCSEIGIAVEAGVFTGFPSETAAEAEDTYRFVRDHRHVISRADPGGFRLLKGAPVADRPGDFGITLRSDAARTWYHLDFSEKAEHHEATRGAVIERIQRLYPQTALVDVPEDILYTARHGPGLLSEFFDASPDTDTEGEPQGQDLDDSTTLRLADNCELRRFEVTNAGAVRLDTPGPTRPQAAFERSSSSIAVVLDRDLRTIRSLTAFEERVLREIGPTEADLGTVCAALGDDAGRARIVGVVLRLAGQGALALTGARSG